MKTMKKISLLPATALALPLAALGLAAAQVERGFGISNNPDTVTRFVWQSGGARKQPGTEMMLLVQNGIRKYEVNLASAVDVHFAKSELGKIKWCNYSFGAQEAPKTSKKCIPSGTLKPDGEINIP
jgi:hypothetical protein